jgi:hypothetical protein
MSFEVTEVDFFGAPRFFDPAVGGDVVGDERCPDRCASLVSKFL